MTTVRVSFFGRRLAFTALVLLFVGVVVASCGFSPQFAEGAFGCADGGACPPGFTCGGDGRCYTQPPLPDSSPRDVSARDVSPRDVSPRDVSRAT